MKENPKPSTKPTLGSAPPLEQEQRVPVLRAGNGPSNKGLNPRGRSMSVLTRSDFAPRKAEFNAKRELPTLSAIVQHHFRSFRCPLINLGEIGKNHSDHLAQCFSVGMPLAFGVGQLFTGQVGMSRFPVEILSPYTVTTENVSPPHVQEPLVGHCHPW